MSVRSIDWASSGRVDTYEFYTVNPFTLQETGTIDIDAENSTLDWGYYTDNKLTGKLVAVNSTGRNQLIRVKHTIQIPDEDPVTETLGTLFVENSGESAKYKKLEVGLNCYSTLWRLTQDVLVNDFYRQTGYNVIDEMRELAEADGGQFYTASDVDTTRTHTRDILFELNTNKATVLNTIAGWIGCEIGVDGDGYIVCSNYVAPQDKPVVYTFEAGKNCVYLPGVEMEENTDGAVNRVLCYYSTQGSEDSQTVVHSDHVFVDLDAGNKFSYDNIGRRISTVIQYPNVSFGEEPTHEQLKEYATTYLRNNSGSTRYFEIEHAGIPGLQIGDVVQLVNDTDFEEPLNKKGMVTEISMKLGLGAMCTTRIKVID
jgi:hypothetical protein